jgi:hypothetical protein
MKKLFKKTKGLIKGTPTAVLVSVGIHALLLFLAGTWVVFTIIDKKDQRFVPAEKIERPKMQLKKLRVKVKQNSKPKRTTQRIVSKTKQAMPDIQLPEMSGVGGGLSEGIGGFEMMADLSKMTLMGSTKSIGNDLVGTFFDLSRYRDGSRSTLQPGISQEFSNLVREFLDNGWSDEVLAPYYRAPRKLYATQFLIPASPSAMGPLRFGIKEDDILMGGALWLAHYKGKIAHPEGGTFRFRVAMEDMGAVRINGETVLFCSWDDRLSNADPSNWRSSSDEHKKYGLGNLTARVSDWFTLEPGVPVEMELLTGEDWGGYYCCIVLVEEKGVDYPENSEGGPILPVFKTMPTPSHLIDEITYYTIPGDLSLDNDGPIFSLY